MTMRREENSVWTSDGCILQMLWSQPIWTPSKTIWKLTDILDHISANTDTECLLGGMDEERCSLLKKKKNVFFVHVMI